MSLQLLTTRPPSISAGNDIQLKSNFFRLKLQNAAISKISVAIAETGGTEVPPKFSKLRTRVYNKAKTGLETTWGTISLFGNTIAWVPKENIPEETVEKVTIATQEYTVTCTKVGMTCEEDNLQFYNKLFNMLQGN